MSINLAKHSKTFERLGINVHPRQTRAVLHKDCVFEAPTCISAVYHPHIPVKIGAYTLLNMPTLGRVEIGRYCSIAGNTFIGSGDHPTDRFTTSPITFARQFKGWREYTEAARGLEQHMDVERFDDRPMTVIGNDVWIGQSAFIRGGVTIGDGAIIAAGAVVVDDVAPYSIVGGVPARLIKMRFDDRTIERLMTIKWWEYPATEFKVKPSEIDALIDWLEEHRGSIPKLDPVRYSTRDLVAIARDNVIALPTPSVESA